jgi:hypothetical protein
VSVLLLSGAATAISTFGATMANCGWWTAQRGVKTAVGGQEPSSTAASLLQVSPTQAGSIPWNAISTAIQNARVENVEMTFVGVCAGCVRKDRCALEASVALSTAKERNAVLMDAMASVVSAPMASGAQISINVPMVMVVWLPRLQAASPAHVFHAYARWTLIAAGMNGMNGVHIYAMCIVAGVCPAPSNVETRNADPMGADGYAVNALKERHARMDTAWL